MWSFVDFGQNHSGSGSISLCRIRGCIMSLCLGSHDIGLEHLVKMSDATSSMVERCTIFLFIVNIWLGGHTLMICKYLFLQATQKFLAATGCCCGSFQYLFYSFLSVHLYWNSCEKELSWFLVSLFIYVSHPWANMNILFYDFYVSRWCLPV